MTACLVTIVVYLSLNDILTLALMNTITNFCLDNEILHGEAALLHCVLKIYLLYIFSHHNQGRHLGGGTGGLRTPPPKDCEV